MKNHKYKYTFPLLYNSFPQINRVPCGLCTFFLLRPVLNLAADVFFAYPVEKPAQLRYIYSQ